MESNSNLSPKCRQALWLAERGMHVFPLIRGMRIPTAGCKQCAPSSPDYVPHQAADCACGSGRPCHGSYAATVDAGRIRHWWAGRHADAGIGIHLGRSGLVMLDLDSHKSERVDAATALRGVRPTISKGLTAADGWDALAMLAAETGEQDPWQDPTAVRVLTPSGGLHIWYRVEDADRYRNIDGKLAWQVDVKAGAAFAVAPGTRVDGKGEYRALPGSSWGTGPTFLPVWLATEIRRVGGYTPDAPSGGLAARLRGSQRPGDRVATPPSSELVETVVAEALDLLASAPSGQRNAALNAAAFKVGRALLSRDESLRDSLGERLEAAAVDGGTPASEARATVASGFLGGINAARK